MLIKKFTAATEKEAILLAKDELGKDAIVMNIRTVNPKGFYKLFKKSTVEVTAAIDDNPVVSKTVEKKADNKAFATVLPITPLEPKPFPEKKEESTEVLKARIDNLENMIVEKHESVTEEKKEQPAEEDKNFECLKLIYNQLIDNEVGEKYANQIISEVEQTLKKDSPINNILSAVYQKIILKLGTPSGLDICPGKTRFIFFIGPTGVGKTTTIAKLASMLSIEKKLKCALVTSDTYRIAAVEQLTTYSNILNIPLKVIYENSEMNDAREAFRDYDVVLVDTAGRSHRNREQRDDIERLINTIPEEDREIFLVLSVTTKYRDLIKITEAYSQISNYKLIFTKLDETGTYGNVLNVRMATGAALAYSTFGQNVPDDICEIDTQGITKQLLGGVD